MAVIKKTVAPSTPDVIKEYPQGDGEVKTGGMIQGDAPQQIWGAASMNPSMQSDSAQKTIDNVPEATAQGGASTPTEQDWRAGLKNPNQHLENYGDDSSLPYQEHPETLGGTMAKYEGEGVMTTSGAEIDKNKQLDQLDPSYRYGKQSQIYGSTHDGYIQERNDNIATALWNAGIRDPEGIRAWLEKQPGFMESSEHDRNNTVMSIYKRMGTEPAKQQDAGNSANKDEGVNLQDVGEGRIYGKDTPYEGDLERGMRTEVDPMNITNLMNVARENNVKALAGMNPEDIATSILAGYTPMGDQAYRDLQQFYPSIYAQVQDALKAKRGQQDINSLTTTGTVDASEQAKTDSERLQNDKDQWSKTVGGSKSDSLLEQANQDMASNTAASSAEEEMNNCQKDIASLQTRLKNLPKEARSAFKGDVPQYLVNAYVANKSQEIQDQISELQSRYNAAMNLYQVEWEKYKWGKEYDLKKKQLEIDAEKAGYDIWAGKQKIAQGWYELGKDVTDLNGGVVVGSGTGKMRTERNNNPTAMTTDYAKMLGGVEGVDYVRGDSFEGEDGRTYYTARLLGDPIQKTIELLNKACDNPNITNPFGGWTYWKDLGIAKDSWKTMSDDDKVEAIYKFLKHEGGDMTKMAYYNSEEYDPDLSGIYQKILAGDITTGPAKMVVMASLGVDSWEAATQQAKEWKRNQEVKNLTKGWEDDVYTSYYRLSDEDINSLKEEDKKRLESAFGSWNAFIERRDKYTAEVVKPEGLQQGKEVLTNIAELINLFKEGGKIYDDGTLDRTYWDRVNPGAAINRKIAQVQDALKLEKLIEARNNGATFGSMTEGEWKIIQDAATAFGGDWAKLFTSNEAFTRELNNVVRKLWKATYGKEPTDTEWSNFVSNVGTQQNQFDVSTSKKGSGAITREQADGLRDQMEGADTAKIVEMIKSPNK